MSVIFICILMQWFESLIAKCLMTPYFIGWRTIGSNPSTIKLWWTQDISKMIAVPSMKSDLWFFIGGIFQWHYILSLTTVLFIFALERSFACYFVKDYEKTSRNYILVFIQVLNHALLIILTYWFFYSIFHFVVAFWICLLPNIFSICMFISTNQYNKKVINCFETSYTLASKFQARENYRAQRLVARVFVWALVMLTFGAFLVLLMLLEIVPGMDTFFNFLLDNLIHLNPLIICPLFIFSVDSWKRHVIHHLPGRKRGNRRVHDQTPPSSAFDLKFIQLRKDTEIHFSQLESAWI
ncbi:unnamed protein product [Caenorhabditis angaria]|uniref:Serpentine receptor class gamma n=1 Tax=Caenorhabditis angaria TaxID=860376 RepID=A0A9P1IDZ0_9PELO|nr:unnamed protein product [Caenorhabditis angaria]